VNTIAFMGVENFQAWPELLPDDGARTRATAIVGAAYGVGLLGGLIWGGWRGVLAGWAGAAAIKYGMGTVVYLQQTDPAYRDVAKLTGVLTVADLIVASWLASGVLESREDEGRSAFGFAH